MSDEEKPKKRRGRPKDIHTPASNIAPIVAYRHAISMSEAIREKIDPTLILKFHNLVISGQHPVWILDKHGNPSDVKPDPSPLAQTPDLTKKLESLKFITAYGWGQPVQSTQVDVEIRARIDQMGSGVSNAELASKVGPGTLKALQRLLLPQKTDNSDAVDAEWEDVPQDNLQKNDLAAGLGRENTEKPSKTEQLSTVNEGPDKNNPLPETDSGGSDDQ